MNKPRVSVVVPVYNVEKYIHRCLESLLKQTLIDIEIILVDDGSLDDSGKICDDYAKSYTNIKVIHKVNEGLGYARNSGLEVASGEFVGFIDSDDFIDVSMYEDLYSYAKKESLDTVFSAGFKFYNNGEIKENLEVPKYMLWSGEEIKRTFIPNIIGAPPTYKSDVKYAMSVCRGIYSLKIIRNNELSFMSEREYLSEDILFNLDYLIKSNKIGMVPKCYYYYCSNEGSLTRSYRADMKERMNKLYNSIKDKLQNEGMYDYANINLSRLYLLMTRGAIKSEFLHNIEAKNRKSKLKAIYDDEILNDILVSYPSSLLPFKHRIFFYLLKYRASLIFRVFVGSLAK